jgi:hypothetical protein
MALRNFEPKLAVEIIKPKYGSGYRIGGRLVLTAKHLFRNGENSGCKVRAKQTFGEVDAEVVWTAPNADVALVALPEDVDGCEPIVFGCFPSEPKAAIVDFDLFGWPKWARTMGPPGEPGKAGGRHIVGKIYLADTSPDGLLVVEPQRGPEAPNPDKRGSEWEGTSGAAVVCNGFVVAVQHHHQNPRRAASLGATLLSRVYNDPTWCNLLGEHGIGAEPEDVPIANRLRNVISSASYAQQDHRQNVVGAVTSRLTGLSQDHLHMLAKKMYDLAKGEASGISLTLPIDSENLAHQTACCMVDNIAVSDVIRSLVGLMRDMERRDATRIADIIDYLLPLNYVPDVIKRLHQQVDEDGLGLVENEVVTRTLAEIIMAGYEQKPAVFEVFADSAGSVRGSTALSYDPGPEVGPGDLGVNTSGLQHAVRDLFCHLLALLDVTPQHTSHANLTREIDDYAMRLQEILRAERTFNKNERSLYYVLKLPREDPKRAFLKQVLNAVCKLVPQLFFVELAPFQKHPGESEMDRYIQHIVRLVRTQND